MSQPWRDRRPHFFSLGFPQLLFSLETPATEASGGLGAVTKVFRETRISRPRVLLSLAVLSLDLLASAAKAQTVINFRSGFTGATGHITLANPPIGGVIHPLLSQCRWTC